MTSETPVSGSIVVGSEPSAIVDVYRQILTKLQRNNFCEDDIFAVHLALEEAFINAIKHGSKMDPTKKVQIDYSVDSDKVEISITDQGEGFNPGLVPDPRVDDNIYKPEGRGILLINSFMDVVQYNERGNCVYMTRYKEKPDLTKSKSRK